MSSSRSRFRYRQRFSGVAGRAIIQNRQSREGVGRMAATSTSAPVLFSELRNAFDLVCSGNEFDNRAYISLETGAIYIVSDIGDIAEGPEDMEDSDQYLAVPHGNDLDLGRNLV